MVERRRDAARSAKARMGGLFGASNESSASSGEMPKQVVRNLGSLLFRNEVARRHHRPADVCRALRPPQREWVEQLVHHAALAPQHQGLATDLGAGGARGAVVIKVNAGRGAVVLATRVQCLGPAEAALVLGQGLGLDVRQAGGSGAGWISRNQW